MTPRLATATLTATLALAFATAPEAEAAAVQSYSYATSGSISGMSGDQPIEFWGVPTGTTLTTPGAFTLGEFITKPLPATATLSYNNTPFTIDVIVQNAMNSTSSTTDYTISGQLNGSINGVGVSSMVATITSMSATLDSTNDSPPFPIANLLVTAPQGINAPNGQNDGFSTLTGQVIPGLGLPTPAPEPTSIAVFGIALAGWACHRRSRSRARV